MKKVDLLELDVLSESDDNAGGFFCGGVCGGVVCGGACAGSVCF